MRGVFTAQGGSLQRKQITAILPGHDYWKRHLPVRLCPRLPTSLDLADPLRRHRAE